MSRITLFGAATVLVLGGTFAIVSFTSGGHTPESAAQDEGTASQAVIAEVVFPPPAVFDHDFHIDDAELDCVDCHHETEAVKLVTPHEEYFEGLWITCDDCHYSDEVVLDPQACVDCHPRSTSGIDERIISAKVATHLSCWECHDSGTGAEASENCSFCHQE
ncbi:MAG: cytochrome c3 family protein [Rhodothermales bacterium]|nr:cytochrome c3 family protein [Rhodothermales bacterium]